MLDMVNVFLRICYYLPLNKGVAPHLKKIETLSTKDALYQVWLKLAEWKRFLNFVNVLSPLGKEWGPSFVKTWIPFKQRCCVPSLVENGLVVLEKKIFKFLQCIFAVLKLFPLRKELGSSFEQTWIPCTKEYFLLSLLEIGPVVLEKNIFKCCKCIFIIISPLKRA